MRLVHHLAKMMQIYERYRSTQKRVMIPPYTNRSMFIAELVRMGGNQCRPLFNNSSEVQELVRKQMQAHISGMLGKPGWQLA